MTDTSAANAEAIEPVSVSIDTETIAASDGADIAVRTWRPAGEARGVIQLIHGLGEHIDRYSRFAEAAVARDLLVVGHSHRGHGEQPVRRGSFGQADGWSLLEADALSVREYIDEIAPGLPVIMLGHSMGSFLAQTFAMHHGGRLKGLILSGSGWPSRAKLLPGLLVARLTALSKGRNGHSAHLDNLGFGSLNKAFEPGRSEYDWLSRDEAEVDKYVADPRNGGPFTVGLWIDFLGGMLRIGSDSAVMRIPSDLPILITGGGDDPVGGEKGMGELRLHYAQTSHTRLKLKLYPEGRHEMLNETNRDEVTRDWLDWIDGIVRR